MPLLAAQWELTFHACRGEVVFGKDMPRVANASVSVMPHALLKGDLMVSDAVAIPLLEFVPELVREPSASTASATPRSSKGASSLLSHVLHISGFRNTLTSPRLPKSMAIALLLHLGGGKIETMSGLLTWKSTRWRLLLQNLRLSELKLQTII